MRRRKTVPVKRPDGRTFRARSRGVGARPPGEGGTSGRHQAILDAAALLMQQRGFVGTTIEDVAQQLELTKAAFYYYVQNKEELLFQILSQTLNVTVERIALIERSSATPHEKLRAIIDAFVHLMADRPDFFTVYFQEKGHLDPGHLRTITKTEATIVHTIERVYRQGVSQGTFQKIDPTVAAFGILGLCFWVHKWFRPQGRLGIEEVSRAFQSLAADGYLAHAKAR